MYSYFYILLINFVCIGKSNDEFKETMSRCYFVNINIALLKVASCTSKKKSMIFQKFSVQRKLVKSTQISDEYFTSVHGLQKNNNILT